tara:strand:+ start:939 stop:1301 length:363 start_codon:yes stop_codon:yes gene_type:complete
MEALEAQVINLITGSLSACGIMVLWFDTSFLLDYLKILKIEKEFVKEYEKKLFENPEIKLLEFSYFENPTFINKLFSCPYCLGFWISMFCTVVATQNILLIFVGYIFTLLFYFIFKKCQN